MVRSDEIENRREAKCFGGRIDGGLVIFLSLRRRKVSKKRPNTDRRDFVRAGALLMQQTRAEPDHPGVDVFIFEYRIRI